MSFAGKVKTMERERGRHMGSHAAFANETSTEFGFKDVLLQPVVCGT